MKFEEEQPEESAENLLGVESDAPQYIYDFDEVAVLGYTFPFTVDWVSL